MENNNDHTDRLTLKVFGDIRTVFNLTEADEQYLRANLKWRTFKKGHILDGRNEILQNMIYIHRGAARTYYIENGREHNYAFSFSSHYLIKPRIKLKHQIFAQFMTESEVCYNSEQMFGSLRDKATTEMYKLMNMGMISHIKHLEEQMFMLHLSARERYEWVLEKYPHLLDYVSITQLASFLNVTKETLYRIRSGKYGNIE